MRHVAAKQGSCAQKAPSPGIDGALAPDVVFRSMIAIWTASTGCFILHLLLTPAPSGSRTVLLAIVDTNLAVLLLLVIGRKSLPSWTIDVCGLLLTAIVGALIVTYNDASTPYAFFYLWLTVHWFSFLHWGRAAIQLAFVGANYAVALAVLGPPFPAFRWSATMLTAIVVGVTVALFRSQVTSLVRDLAATARTDSVTLLGNRRAFDELFDGELERAQRGGTPMALVLGDLDRFKLVNDRLGHPEGDEVLRRVAHQLRLQRRVDAAFRLGGDEFALVLPATDADGALIVAERVRAAIVAEFARDQIPVTISLGVACRPEHALDPQSLFGAADSALLAAKRQGRNRTVIGPPGPPEGLALTTSCAFAVYPEPHATAGG